MQYGFSAIVGKEEKASSQANMHACMCPESGTDTAIPKPMEVDVGGDSDNDSAVAAVREIMM